MANNILKKLESNKLQYQIITYKKNYNEYIIENNFDVNNDTKIIATAYYYKLTHPEDKVIFITNDLCLKHISKNYFEEIQSITQNNDYEYDGYKEINLNEEELNYFYQNLSKNIYNLLINQYLILKYNDKVIDILCWTGEKYRKINYNNITSNFFGTIKPIKNDYYQQIAIDSLYNNTITMLKGPAGTGKSLLSLSFLMNQLEKNKIDKIIIFCNTIATKDSAKLGYYPGTKDEKLLDSQIGNFLTSKLGNKIAVERLLNEEKLVLLPLSDIRGYDTTGMKAGIYITEAQNLNIHLMQLALQRIGEDSICIIDGDYTTQVDDLNFYGDNNGMKRMSQVFKNHNIYGEITLKNIHRSKIAKIAENM